ncbi:MAG: hypothetical protein ABFD54_07435 [Armatimonadota bacterium]|nr:hypothetical protein [bacterium]
MRRALLIAVALLVLIAAAVPVFAKVTSSGILSRVKTVESSVKDLRADMVITEANKKNVSGMGEGYGDILRLQKAVISYKSPNLIRYDGYAEGIKAAYIQNGYNKLILAAMIRQKENVKNAPGKRQDSLDLGFLNSDLWKDNHVTVVSTGKNGVVKLNFDPKFGGTDKRHDYVWVDSKTLKLVKREKYRGNGEMRLRTVYSSYQTIGGKLPIATMATLYDGGGRELGSIKYKNVKANTGLSNALFSMNQR